MRQPKRRAALLTGLASAAVALGFAPLPAHAQFPGFPGAGTAMPGFGAGVPSYGAGMPFSGLGAARPGAGMPGMNSMIQGMNATMPRMGATMPGQTPWLSPAPVRSAWPTYGAVPAYGAGPFVGRSYPSAAPLSEPTAPDRSFSRSYSRLGGGAPGFYEDAPRRGGETVREGAAVSRPLRAESVRPPLLLDRRVPTVRPVTHPNNLQGRATVPPPAAGTGNTYLYAPQAPVTTLGGPALLGGYYYGGYCDSDYGTGTYLSVYSLYDGFPQYIYNPGVTFENLSGPGVYIAEPQPFTPPMYTVTYNQNNYYVPDQTKAAEIEDGGAPAKQAVHQSFPADTYQAAFADIERAWTDGNLDLLKKHLHSDDTKISVYLSSQYKYSLNSSDFAQITKDAFDRLDTVSFQFTSLRKAKNGDVTAYGKHVYRVADTGTSGGGATSDKVIPFDTSAAPADGTGDNADSAPSPTAGQEKTVYVAYTLRRGTDVWYIVSINSSTDPLVKE